MPTFHTKTISSILDPVAQQVSQLILIHDQAANGLLLPDLQVPVSVVKNAVLHLVKVGHDTIQHSDDRVLNEDMPPCLKKVEDAAEALHESAQLLKADSTSIQAQKKLIEGSRGILNGVSQLLLTLDQSEVRKIVLQCSSVLDFLATTEIVHSMEDLADFVRKLTPILSKMSKSVESRITELTIQSHKDRLKQGVEKVRSLIPLLVSSMKVHVTIWQQRDVPDVAALLPASESNRDYAVLQISHVVQEISRVLQLTHEEFNVEVISTLDPNTTLEQLRRLASDSTAWIHNPDASVGTQGEKSFRQLLALVGSIAQLQCHGQTRSPHDASNNGQVIDAQDVRHLESVMGRLSHHRLRHEGRQEEALKAGRECERYINDLVDKSRLILLQMPHGPSNTRNPASGNSNAVGASAMSGPSLSQDLEQAVRWLTQPWITQLRPGGPNACYRLAEVARAEAEELFEESHVLTQCLHQPQSSVVSDAEQKMRALSAQEESRIFQKLADSLEEDTHKLEELVQKGDSQNSAMAQGVAYNLLHAVYSIRNRLHMGLVNQVTEKLNDIFAPMRGLVEAAKPMELLELSRPLVEEEKLTYLQQLENRQRDFLAMSDSLMRLAVKLATHQISDQTDVQRRLCQAVNELSPLTEEVCLAASTVLQWRLQGNNMAECVIVDEHFDKMQERWTAMAEQLRVAIDEATDRRTVLQVQEMGMLRATEATEASIVRSDASGVVHNTANIARRAHRVLQIAKLEADNSADATFVDRMNDVVHQLRDRITPMVVSAKFLVGNLRDDKLAERWRVDNSQLIHAVGSVKDLLAIEDKSAIRPAFLQQPSISPSPTASLEMRPRVPAHAGNQQPSSETIRTSVSQSTKLGSSNASWNDQDYDQPPIPVQEMAQLTINTNSNNEIELDEGYYEHSNWASYPSGDANMFPAPGATFITHPRGNVPPHHNNWTEVSSGYPYPLEGASSYAPAYFYSQRHSQETPLSPDTDHPEEEFRFPAAAPQEDEPIIAAAHALHCEANQWSSRGNDLVAAAKRMAYLMGQLGVIVERGGDSKRELIQVSMAIAEASREVSRLGLLLATQCTDKRIQKNLEEFCSQVSTVGTQLKILSTVKASMLGTQDASNRIKIQTDEDDKQNTEMLVLNAGNLMKAVTAVVKAAETASIKSRLGETDKMKLRWVRRQPLWLTNVPQQLPPSSVPSFGRNSQFQ